ncbi:MAG: flagellar biosynthetic protein FliR [Ilumatobacter sp.]|uniref:flagellar biosynthetic protein FliR n=1 Tax=Ilumatobacter sp. TaxID=1967498 RepID=UPI00262F5E99|nr:flagellar biosynthetic protein FliR [Ilumatobacter sp.]MDJ0767437.1 flagellar biosynthetic protein FliR [Ilumatobacter sp.]
MELEIATSTLIGFCFALVRTTAWIVICPPFNSPAVPVRVRVGLATAISFVLAGRVGSVAMAGEADPLAIGPFVVALVMQALAGIALGFAVYILFTALQAAGDLIDLQVGFSLGAVLDPISGASSAPIGRFHQLLGLIVVFAIDGHVLVVRGYLRSVEAVPTGRIDIGRLAEELAGLGTVFFTSAVEIALPVLAALFCTEIALGLLGKAAPQLNILMLGFAAKTFVAIILLGLTLALLPASTESLLVRSVTSIGRAFGG